MSTLIPTGMRQSVVLKMSRTKLHIWKKDGRWVWGFKRYGGTMEQLIAASPNNKATDQFCAYMNYRDALDAHKKITAARNANAGDAAGRRAALNPAFAGSYGRPNWTDKQAA